MAKNKKPKFSVAGSSSKAQALEMMIGQIEKQFGPGSIMKIGEEHNSVEQDAVISTQSISLDVALGVGGFPKGRIIEIYGPESSGKTTLTLHAIASAQKMGGVVVFIDAAPAEIYTHAPPVGLPIGGVPIGRFGR